MAQSSGDGRAQEDEVDRVVDGRADCDARDEGADRSSVHGLDREAAGERREREHRAVEGDAQRRPARERVRHGRSGRCHEHACVPAEEHDRRDREDEPEGDAAGVDPLDRYREALGEDDAEEERHQRHDVGRSVWSAGIRSRRDRNAGRSGEAGRDDNREDALRYPRAGVTSRDSPASQQRQPDPRLDASYDRRPNR